ncbi:MAG: CDP-diacylglycerol--glycerol-3-phosphate 3-phosphatidyltransferase [Isosphaera sp.]|nr:CDP-diacylglycerol--glycerol-3-phosphate 3-phosphatidyltransferase [Isosphaera sp.]
MADTPPSPVWNVPNLLSLSRLPLAVVLFALIARAAWPAALAVFAAACATDWLDGWWARRYGPLTAVGRALDPLTDKVLVCGAFVFLIPVPAAGIDPWVVAVVVGRELLVTGLRGMVEAAGKAFGADRFGKLKMGLQCAVVVAVLVVEWVRDAGPADALAVLEPVRTGLLWAMLAATVGSGAQYAVKAVRLLR